MTEWDPLDRLPYRHYFTRDDSTNIACCGRQASRGLSVSVDELDFVGSTVLIDVCDRSDMATFEFVVFRVAMENHESMLGFQGETSRQALT